MRQHRQKKRPVRSGRRYEDALENLFAMQNDVQTFPLFFLSDAQSDKRLGDHQ